MDYSVSTYASFRSLLAFLLIQAMCDADIHARVAEGSSEPEEEPEGS